MGTKDELKDGLNELIGGAGVLLDLLNGKNRVLEFGNSYHKWYTKAIKIVEFLAKDRLSEFISYYSIDPKRKERTSMNYTIQDFINGHTARKNSGGKELWDTNNIVFIELCNQTNILESLESRIDSIFSDVEGVMLSKILDKELATAKSLTNTHVRAAGALAGVVLESHLQKVASNHLISSSKKEPTISDLNELLKGNGIIDVPTWRKIQFLGDIRNLCSHKKTSDPSVSQVEELIQGVNDIIKTVF